MNYKKGFCLILSLLLLPYLSFSQSLTIIDSNGSVFLEKEADNGIFTKTIRIGPSGKNSLKGGLNKGIEWAKLNKKHYRSFEKEICRFKSMDGKSYETFGYVPNLSNTTRIRFVGYSSGRFNLIIEIKDPLGYTRFWETNSISNLEDFVDILNGKTVNSEIDEIFH